MLKMEYLLLVLGMGLVTYLPRVIPLILLSNRKIPRWMIEWLDLIPVAILAGLLFPLLFVSESSGNIDIFRLELLGAIPVIIFAVITKSLSLTVILGMLLFWFFSNIMTPY